MNYVMYTLQDQTNLGNIEAPETAFDLANFCSTLKIPLFTVVCLFVRCHIQKLEIAAI